MKQNDLIHPSHHGFRAGHSTTTGLIEMYDTWVESIESGNYSAACFLDLSAAFDVVDHTLLIEKLVIWILEQLLEMDVKLSTLSVAKSLC